MDLRTDPLRLDLLARVTLDAAQDTLFLDSEKMRIRSSDDVVFVSKSVEAVCAPHLNRVDVFVNFGDFKIDDEVVAA